MWEEAKADKHGDVGQWFTWNVTDADACYGYNPVDENDGVNAQGSWACDGAFSGIEAAMASFGSATYADYLVDAMANSWTKNLGIDGYTIDVSASYPAGDPECQNGMLQCGGDSQGVWASIVDRVRELQPQVVLSGESFGSWDEVMHSNSDIGGQGFQSYHDDFQAAVLNGDASDLEAAAANSGADAASVLCYLHPHYDGKQPGECATMYFRDTSAVMADPAQHAMWVAMEAASGIVSEHDYDPNSWCTDEFNGCSEYGQGAYWNVTQDPFVDGEDSPLWAFTKYRALNRLALRTKLDVAGSNGANNGASKDDYTEYAHKNAYAGAGAVEIDSVARPDLTVDECTARCDEDDYCSCVAFMAYSNFHGQSSSTTGDCWKRASCVPDQFESDAAAAPYSVYVKPHDGSPGGALAYLKHDSMGPDGDAALTIFNPGAAQKVTLDLSSLPASLTDGSVVPIDLLALDADDAVAATEALPPLTTSWTIEMGAGEMRLVAGFGLGVFAPRAGKRGSCVADDAYSKQSGAPTLQACFLECAADDQCENVLLDASQYQSIYFTEAPPAAVCTLLGAIADPAAACTDGDNTLVTALLNGRPQ